MFLFDHKASLLLSSRLKTSTFVIFAILGFGQPLSAQGINQLPDEVSADIRSADKVCLRSGGKPRYEPLELVKAVDLSGDGREDFIVDYSRYTCVGVASLFCGSGGCSFKIFGSTRSNRWTLAFDEIVLSSEIVSESSNPYVTLETKSGSCSVPEDDKCKLRVQISDGRIKYLSTTNESSDGLVAYNKGDFKKALEIWQLLADGGDASAQYNMGILYDRGQGVPQDVDKALQWYRRAADQSLAPARHALGLLHLMGRGTVQDNQLGVSLIEQAGETGLSDAQATLCSLYLNGQVVESDLKQALFWCRKAAEQSHVDAQFNLAFMYLEGRGIQKNDQEGLLWLRRAADQGHADSQFSLGLMYLEGRGGTRSADQAFAWFSKAAAAGHSGAQNNLGDLYENGLGVTADDTKALEWYRKSADQGNAAGQWSLATMYARGKGVKKDELEALRLFKLAASQKEAPEEIRRGAAADLERLEKLTTVNLEKSPQSVGGGTYRKLALVIGNSSYSHVIPLVNPKNDATAISETLKSMGFSVLSGVDLSKRDMEEKIRKFAEEARDADVTLFFYAGHGIQVSGQNYLVPVDAELRDSTAIDFELINIAMLTNYMGGKDKVGIVLLDACRDNPFVRALARSVGLSRSVTIGTGLATVSAAAGGMLIGFATAPDNVAQDGTGTVNSPFTTALLKHLPTPGLEIQQVMTRVKAEVIRMTDNKQRPWHNSDLASEIVLAEPKK